MLERSRQCQIFSITHSRWATFATFVTPPIPLFSDPVCFPFHPLNVPPPDSPQSHPPGPCSFIHTWRKQYLLKLIPLYFPQEQYWVGFSIKKDLVSPIPKEKKKQKTKNKKKMALIVKLCLLSPQCWSTWMGLFLAAVYVNKSQPTFDLLWVS